jgi:hypothetical protein
MLETKIAVKAIKTAIRNGEIVRDISAFHRIAMEAIRCMFKIEQVANDMAYHAAKKVYYGD